MLLKAKKSSEQWMVMIKPFRKSVTPIATNIAVFAKIGLVIPISIALNFYAKPVSKMDM